MITIPDALQPEHVLLDLQAPDSDTAIATVAGLLKDDPRILDWAGFFRAVHEHIPCRMADAGDFSICLPHARTEAVGELAISAARLDPGIVCPGARAAIRYIFCIGAPKTMAADYLRLAGALMRILSDPEAEERLHTAASAQEFLEVLGAREMKL
jgi:mannitol/fructose-specific phosphotransferase system IIA component (Ntr-type)